MTTLFRAINLQSQVTDSVIVSFSMGKDSIVALDFAYKHFNHVYPFFMYLVPGLEFQERDLRRYEQQYDTKIIRVPHFENSEFFRYGSFREPDETVQLLESMTFMRVFVSKPVLIGLWVARRLLTVLSGDQC